MSMLKKDKEKAAKKQFNAAFDLLLTYDPEKRKRALELASAIGKVSPEKEKRIRLLAKEMSSVKKPSTPFPSWLIDEARSYVKDIHSDTEKLLTSLRSAAFQNAIKNSYVPPVDPLAYADKALLKKFDRWFNIYDEKLGKNPTEQAAMAIPNLERLQERALRLLDAAQMRMYPIYDLRKTERVSWPPDKKFSSRHKPYDRWGVHGRAHVTAPKFFVTYWDKEGNILANLKGPWLAIMPGFDGLTDSEQPAAIIHEWIHVANRLTRKPGGHRRVKGLDLSGRKPLLSATEAFENASSWASYAMNQSEYRNER